MFLIGRYPAQVSVALSTVMIFGASSSVYLMLIPKRHPLTNGRPLVDYHAALITEPIILAGSIVGVFLNVWFPNWLLTILLLLILLFVSVRSITKGMQQWKKESLEIKKKKEAVETKQVEETQVVEMEEQNEEESAREEEDATPKEEIQDQDEIHEDLGAPLKDASNILLEKIKKYELHVFPIISWALLSVSWIIVFISSFLKGGKSFPSVIGIVKCSWECKLICVLFIYS